VYYAGIQEREGQFFSIWLTNFNKQGAKQVIIGQIENLLDKEYEEAKGLGTPGISFFGGIKLSF
jgi:hypothetical protein